MRKQIDLGGQWQVTLQEEKNVSAPDRSGQAAGCILPGTLDENHIGRKDLLTANIHPDQPVGSWMEEKGPEDASGDGQSEADAPIKSRFRRKYTYTGEAVFSKRLLFDPAFSEGVWYLEAERTRELRLFIDGEEIPAKEGTLSTPYRFDVTGHLFENAEIRLLSDNSYKGWPAGDILYSSAATDETQTNWNGILGFFHLVQRPKVYIDRVNVYPRGETLSVCVRIGCGSETVRCSDSAEGKADARRPDSAAGKAEEHGTGTAEDKADVRRTKIAQEVKLCLTCEAFAGRKKGISKDVFLLDTDTETEVWFEDIPLQHDVRKWDEYEGNLYTLHTALYIENGEANKEDAADRSETSFGVREIAGDAAGRLTLNGRRFFLRGEANCAVFPETGHMPLTVQEWENILKRYMSYGVNIMRFHSHCPPDAAFTAADALGIMMQPELSHWNPKNAFETPGSISYYRRELLEILSIYGNHPSFVLLTFGNELNTGEAGLEAMKELLDTAKKADATRLYAYASNMAYGEQGCFRDNDFYTASNYYKDMLRATSAGMEGHLNKASQIGAMADYRPVLRKLRETFGGPVFGFEVGQYEVLPDWEELADFHGVTEPENLRFVQKRADQMGSREEWKKMVEASGELALLCYREEVEAVLRTPEMSGLSLLGLQDFPGQGTALVGMMNAHLDSKPYAFARPERFQAFFRSQLPLLLLPTYTFRAGEVLEGEIRVANYGKEDLEGELNCRLIAASAMEAQMASANASCKRELHCETWHAVCPKGEVTSIGELSFVLPEGSKAAEYEIEITIGDARNTYPVWVYPKEHRRCPEGVYESKHFDEKAKEVLRNGGTVYLTPPSDQESLPLSIKGQFSTDFWSVATFPFQEGGMGQLIDASHPLFKSFPSKDHTSWQWHRMASQRAVILPRPMKCIVREMDSCLTLRPMAQLFACRCGGGNVLFSTLALWSLQEYPEAEALQGSIYDYLSSGRFLPEEEMTVEEMEAMVR